MDFGSQDIVVRDQSHLAELKGILADLKSPWKENLGGTFPVVIPVLDLLEGSSIDYYCLDIDDRPRTIDIDLNVGDFDPKYRHYFDLVFNCGTTEHVINPVTAFFSIHEMCRIGGIIYHHTPLFGLGHHGFINFTPKFWHHLVWMNDYEVVKGAAERVDESILDRGNLYMDHLAFIEGLEKVRDISYVIELSFLKRHAHCFIPPIDIWPGMSRARLVSMISSVCWGYHSCNAISLTDIENTVCWFVERMGI